MRAATWVVVSALALGSLAPLGALAGDTPRSAVSALSLVLPEVRFEGTPLAEAVDRLQTLSNANFHVNWKALEAVNITRDTPVSVRARNTTLRKTMSLMLAQMTGGDQLSFYNEEGVIEITSRQLADEKLVTKVYDINDLLIIMPNIGANSNGQGGQGRQGGTSSGVSTSGSGMTSDRSSGGGRSSSASAARTPSRAGTGVTTSSNQGGGRSGAGQSGQNNNRQQMADDLATLIRDLIDPDVWIENGGKSSIRAFRASLIITAPRRVHERIGGAIE